MLYVVLKRKITSHQNTDESWLFEFSDLNGQYSSTVLPVFMTRFVAGVYVAHMQEEGFEYQIVAIRDRIFHAEDFWETIGNLDDFGMVSCVGVLETDSSGPTIRFVIADGCCDVIAAFRNSRLWEADMVPQMGEFYDKCVAPNESYTDSMVHSILKEFLGWEVSNLSIKPYIHYPDWICGFILTEQETGKPLLTELDAESHLIIYVSQLDALIYEQLYAEKLQMPISIASLDSAKALFYVKTAIQACVVNSDLNLSVCLGPIYTDTAGRSFLYDDGQKLFKPYLEPCQPEAVYHGFNLNDS